MSTGIEPSSPARQEATLAWVSDIDRDKLLPDARRGARLLNLGYIVPRVAIPIILMASIYSVFQGLQTHAWFERNLWGLHFLDRSYTAIKQAKLQLYEYVLGRDVEILKSARTNADVAHSGFVEARKRFESRYTLGLINDGEQAFVNTIERQISEAQSDAVRFGDEKARINLKETLLKTPDSVSDPLVKAHFQATSDMMFSGEEFRKQLQETNLVPAVLCLLSTFLILLFWLTRTYLRQRKRNIAALQDSERQVKFLVDNIHDGLAIVDSDGEIEGANRGFLEMLHVADEEALTGKRLSLILGSDIDSVLDAVEDSTLSVVQEREAMRPDGDKFPAEVAISEVRTIDGASRVVTMRDLSQKKALEKWKREMVAIVSHDLRTPLTSMRGALGLVATGALGTVSPAGQEKLQVAQDNVIKMIKLINDLLDLEKLEAATEPIELLPVHLSAVAAQALQGVAEQAGRKHVQVTVDTDSNQVLGEVQLLEKMFFHLLENAIKFSPSGSVVRLSAARSGAWMEVKVEDQGRGIPGEYIDSVFMRMKQVSAADRASGNGLGLPLCKAIAHLHGGVIGLDSSPEKGTTAWVLLKPANQGKDQEVIPQAV